MSQNPLPTNQLFLLVFSRLILLIPLLMAMFFLPAGTFAYWEAWVYMAILLIPMSFVMIYLWRNAPDLLERRMRMKEKDTRQKGIIQFSYVIFILTYLLPGFDHRFGWSDLPIGVVIAADAIILVGYGIFFLVLRENRYASRIIEVAQGQEVIRTGPYGIVRHPMYLGIGLLYLFTPLGLGSFWAFFPGLLIIPILVGRIVNEERTLHQDLKGYTEYSQAVRYRLIPGVW